MMHTVLFSLVAAVALPNSAAPAAPAAPIVASAEHRVRAGDPVIKVWTDWDQYSRGDNADVHIRTREDGYLIVMQADVDGRVRVLFPLDPGADDYVRGGKDIKLPGRNGKGTFYVDGPGGMGMVYAAISSVPFRFNDYAQNDHWDYGALYDKTLDSDFENGFTVLVNKMSTGHFDYDVYRYEVLAQSSYADAPVAYAGPAVYGGSPCWGVYNPWCYGGPLLYGAGPYAYGYGAPFFGVGYGYGGFTIGFGFGWGGYGYGYGGCCYYGGGYYPYYPGYGYGYGYGYPHYGYPYYGSPYYGSGYRPPYTFKPGNPAGTGGTGIGYRPPLTGTPGGIGHTGGTGIGYRPPTTGTPGGFLGPAVGPRGHVPAVHTGYTLGGRAPALHTPASEPRHTTTELPTIIGHRTPTGSNGAGGTNAGTQAAARPPRYQGPPRYEPGRSTPAAHGGQPAAAPRGGASGPSVAPRSGGAPPARYSAPTSVAPRGGGYSAPASHPSGGGSAPHPSGGGGSAPHPSGGGGGGGIGHRVP
jgi:hypothetical protein